jgi:hypothetical protein
VVPRPPASGAIPEAVVEISLSRHVPDTKVRDRRGAIYHVRRQHMPPANGFRVVRSSIHGYGLIATRDFRDCEVVTEVDGILCLGAGHAHERYTLWLDDEWYLDILDQARWINHSCDPNVWIDGGLRGDGTPWARVQALRAIRAGEELTCDYALPLHLAEPCACGAVKCRGWIVDERDLSRLEPAARSLAR